MQTTATVSMPMLRAVFTSQFLPNIFTGVRTHDSVCAFVAQIVRFTNDVKVIEALVESALPPGYSGNSVKEIASMVEGAIARGFAKRTAPSSEKQEKGNQLLDLLLKETALFHDQRGHGIMRIALEGGGFRSLELASAEAASFVRRRYFHTFRRALRASELGDTINTLQALAEVEGDRVMTALRVGKHLDSVYIDLGSSDGSVVVINQNGWSVARDCAVHFLRSAGFQELPAPVKGGDIHQLQNLLSLDEANFYRLLGFLLNALHPAGPYMLLLVEGEQGSGKSFLGWVVKQIVDPNVLAKQKLTESDRDLMLHAQDHHLPVYDNVSGMRGDISDSLCTLATGGGFGTRKLYTDAQQQVFNYCRPFVINGIADFATRPDLLERAILLRLPPLPAASRRVEAELTEDFRAMLPGLLGSLYTAISVALRNLRVTVPPRSLRMADAARWICAAVPSLGVSAGAVLDAIAATRNYE